MAEKINRRQFLEAGVYLAVLPMFFNLNLLQSADQKDTPPWPTDKEAILQRIKELNFPQGTHLRTTLFFRKMYWEFSQVQKMKGTWQGSGDESDWMSQPEVLDSLLTTLAAAGIKGGRLEIVPFEVTKDGVEYDWSAMDTALELMNKNGLAADLCIGPLNFAYDPGVRLPQKFENELKQQAADQNKRHIHISLETDPSFPQLSSDIKDYALQFVKVAVEKYGKDTRIDKFYLGNEWPDTNAIEGISGVTMSVGQDLMEEAIKIITAGSNKKIALNTNIPPSELRKLKETLGEILDLLGDKGVIGLDPYPTQEAKDKTLAPRMSEYGKYVAAVREAFPQAEIVFTEYQAEPWPPGEVAGKSWAEIATKYPELVNSFFTKDFPPSLDSYAVGSQIKEIGLWGAPLWPVMAELEDDFPLQMFAAMNEAMNRKP